MKYKTLFISILCLMVICSIPTTSFASQGDFQLESMSKEEIIEEYGNVLAEKGFPRDQLFLFGKNELILILENDGEAESFRKSYELLVSIDDNSKTSKTGANEMYIVPISEEDYYYFSIEKEKLTKEGRDFQKHQMLKVLEEGIAMGIVTELKTGNTVEMLSTNPEDHVTNTISGYTLYTELRSYDASTNTHIKKGFSYYFDWPEMTSMNLTLTDIMAIKHNGNEYGLTTCYEKGATIAKQSKTSGEITTSSPAVTTQIGSNGYGVTCEFDLQQSKRTYGRMYAVYGNTRSHVDQGADFNVFGRYGHGTIAINNVDLSLAYRSASLSLSFVSGIVQSGQTAIVERS